MADFDFEEEINPPQTGQQEGPGPGTTENNQNGEYMDSEMQHAQQEEDGQEHRQEDLQQQQQQLQQSLGGWAAQLVRQQQQQQPQQQQSLQQQQQQSQNTAESAALREATLSGCKLYLANMTWWSSDVDVEALCGEYGQVLSVDFQLERSNGKSKGIALVEFATPEATVAAKEGLQGRMLHGRALAVTFQAAGPGAKQGPPFTVYTQEGLRNGAGNRAQGGGRADGEGGRFGGGGGGNWRGRGRGGAGGGGNAGGGFGGSRGFGNMGAAAAAGMMPGLEGMMAAGMMGGMPGIMGPGMMAGMPMNMGALMSAGMMPPLGPGMGMMGPNSMMGPG